MKKLVNIRFFFGPSRYIQDMLTKYLQKLILTLLFLPLIANAACNSFHKTDCDKMKLYIPEQGFCAVNHLCFTNDTETHNTPGRQLYIRAGDGYFNLAPGKTSCFDPRNKIRKVKIYTCGITACTVRGMEDNKFPYATFNLNQKQCLYRYYCAKYYNCRRCRCTRSTSDFYDNELYIKIK